jgi:hypothetical protein
MPNMSVADIIKIHGKCVESKEFIKSVSQKMGIGEREAYRKIKDAVNNGDLKKYQLPDRGVLYGLPEYWPDLSKKKSKASKAIPLGFDNAFYYETFKKIDKVNNKVEFAPDEALRELLFLIATLPKEIKLEIKPLQDRVIDAVRAKGRGKWEPSFGLLRSMARDDPDQAFLTECYHQVFFLVNELTSILHKHNKERDFYGY